MNSKIIVRKVRSGEDRAVWEVAKTLSIFECFVFFLLFYRGKVNALVAVNEGRVVGCVVPRITILVGEKIGVIDAAFVNRDIQGKGIGKILVDAALFHFQKEKCKTIYSTVNRYNSLSWNMFLHKGFIPFEFNEQYKIFGWKILLLWWVNGYYTKPGSFILRKTSKERWITREDGEGWYFFIAWLGFSFVLWMESIKQNALWFNFAPFVLGVVGVSIFTHELAHKLVAHFLGLKTIFKIWASGLLFSLFWVLVGLLIPFYGSTYLEQKDWAYNKDVKSTGWIYVAGPVVSLILAFCFLALSHLANTERLVILGILGLHVNLAIVFFNIIPIFPFVMFDGRKIFLWNKIVWAMLVIGFSFICLTLLSYN